MGKVGGKMLQAPRRCCHLAGCFLLGIAPRKAMVLVTPMLLPVRIRPRTRAWFPSKA
jgi:hypothetical protein